MSNRPRCGALSIVAFRYGRPSPLDLLRIRLMTAAEPIHSRPEIIAHSQIVLDSFRHRLGRELFARSGDPADESRRLFEAPFVVVSHGTEADPILNYANRAALEIWESDFATLTTMPSRLTAEAPEREERARLLERTARDGYVENFRCVRISTSGRRFLIERVTVWNLVDAAGRPVGQAATYADWTFLDG